MNTLRMIFIAGLLSVSSAYAHDAGNWTAGIGTGHVSASSHTATAASGNPSSPHWSAAIGTGRVAGDSRGIENGAAVSARVSSASIHARAHWTSKIGTGAGDN